MLRVGGGWFCCRQAQGLLRPFCYPLDMAEKSRLREAMRRADISTRKLAGAAGLHRGDVNNALYYRLSAERAGVLCRTLSELAGLSASERRDLFREMVLPPGKSRLSAFDITTEDPQSELWQGVEDHHSDPDLLDELRKNVQGSEENIPESD